MLARQRRRSGRHRSDPKIQHPRDAVIKITACAICGSDLHRDEVLGPFLDTGDVLGHEPIGIVEEVGVAVTQITPGDRVDVILTRKAQQQPGAASNDADYADVLLQDVKVLGVDQIANASQEKAAVAKAVTLEVTSEQAQKLVLAGGVGTLSLVLRQAGASKPEAARRIGVADLGQPPGEVVGPAVVPAPVPQGAEVWIYRGGTDPKIYRDVYREPYRDEYRKPFRQAR